MARVTRARVRLSAAFGPQHGLPREPLGPLLARREAVDEVVAVLVGRATSHRTRLQTERDHQRIGERSHAEPGHRAFDCASLIDHDLDRRGQRLYLRRARRERHA